VCFERERETATEIKGERIGGERERGGRSRGGREGEKRGREGGREMFVVCDIVKQSSWVRTVSVSGRPSLSSERSMP
jgi:hypothetical protein